MGNASKSFEEVKSELMKDEDFIREYKSLKEEIIEPIDVFLDAKNARKATILERERNKEKERYNYENIFE